MKYDGVVAAMKSLTRTNRIIFLLCVTLSLVVCVNTSFARTKWLGYHNDDQVVVSNTYQWPLALEERPTGGYISAGWSRPDDGNSSIMISLISSNGDHESTMLYGGSASAYAFDMHKMILNDPFDGYVCTGHTENNGVGGVDGNDILIFKVDPAGDSVWLKTYSGPEDRQAFAIEQTSDGGFVVCGRTNSGFASDGNDAYIMKVDSLGNFQWEHTYVGSGGREDVAKDIALDGAGFIVTGYTRPANAAPDVFVLRLNSDGSEDWSTVFTEPGGDYGESITRTADGQFVVCAANLTDFPSQAVKLRAAVQLIKLGSDGSVSWNKVFTDLDLNQQLLPTEVRELTDGRLIVCGTSTNQNFRAFILVADSAGNTDRFRIIGGENLDYAQAIVENTQNTDYDYLMVGWSSSGDTFTPNTAVTDPDIWLVALSDVLADISEIPAVVGDANGDGSFNVVDITYIIARIFNSGPAPIPLLGGDANIDCKVNIADVTRMIADTFGGNPLADSYTPLYKNTCIPQ